MGGRSAFEQYLRQKGFGGRATPAPQVPVSTYAPPTYVSSPVLRTRGVEGRPDLQTRQYMAPPTFRPAIPPQFTPEEWNSLTPEEQALFRPQPTYTPPAPTPDMAPVSPNVISRTTASAGDAVAGTLSQVPGYVADRVTQAREQGLAPTILDVTTDIGTDVAVPVAQAIGNAFSWPKEEWDLYTAREAIRLAGLTPEERAREIRALRVDPVMGTQLIPSSVMGGTAGNDLTLLNYVVSTPGAWDMVNQIVAEAQANGRDPDEAVLAWFHEQQSFGASVVDSVVNDPLNVVPAFGAAGRFAKIKAAVKAAEGSTTEAKILRGLGIGLEGVEQIADAPITLPVGAVKRINRWGQPALQAVPDAGLFGPSDTQRAIDAEREAAETVTAANRVIERAPLTREQAIADYRRRGYTPGDAVAGPSLDEVMSSDPGLSRRREVEVERPADVPEQSPGPPYQATKVIRGEEVGFLPGDPTQPSTATPTAATFTDAVQQPGTTVPRGTGPLPGDSGRAPTPVEAAAANTVVVSDNAIDDIVNRAQRLRSDGKQMLTPEIAPELTTPVNPERLVLPGRDPLPPVKQPGWSNKPKTDPKTGEVTGTTARDRFAREHPTVFREVVDDPSWQKWSIEEYEPRHNMVTKRGSDTADLTAYLPGATGEQGVNKAVRAALEAEQYARLRLMAHTRGVDVSDWVFSYGDEFRRPLADEALIAEGYDPTGTYKHLSKEADAYRYLTGEYTDETEELFRAPSKRKNDVPLYRREPGVTESEQAAYIRYMQARQVRDLMTAGPEDLDAIARANGLVPEPVRIPETDLATLPDAMALAARGAGWEAELVRIVDSLPPDQQTTALQGVLDWARVAYANPSPTATRQALDDITYGARLSAELRRMGIDVPPPRSPWTGNVDELTGSADGFRALVYTQDENQIRALRDAMEQYGVLRYAPPDESLAGVDPTGYAKQLSGWKNYVDVTTARSMIWNDAIPLPGPVFGPPIPRWMPPKPQLALPERVPFRPQAMDTGTIFGPNTKVVSDAEFEQMIGRKMAAPSLSSMKGNGDLYVRHAVELGAIDAEQARKLSTVIDVPAMYDGKKIVRPARQMTVMDLILEKMDDFDTITSVNRATLNDIAKMRKGGKAARTKAKEAKEQLADLPVSREEEAMRGITELDDLTHPELIGLLRANQRYLNLLREALLLSPARVGSAGMLDAFGNGLFQLYAGHPRAAIRTFANPRAWWAFMKHAMRDVPIKHAVFTQADELGLMVPKSIVEIQTRDLLNPTDATSWAKMFGGGKKAEMATGIIASKWGRSFRHAIDQNARLTLWGDTIRQQLRPAQAEFFLHIRRTYGDEAADRAVKELGWGHWNPDDINRVFAGTGYETQLAKKWRDQLRVMNDKAVSEVRRVHFSYRMTKADEILKQTVLFHYWQSRAMLFYPKTVIESPWLLYTHMKMWDTLSKEAEKQGEGNPLTMLFKWMAGPGGMYAIFDPVAMVVPWVITRDVFSDYYEDKSLYDKVAAIAFVNPIFDGAAKAIGISEGRIDFTGTTGLTNLVSSFWNFAESHGADWLPRWSNDANMAAVSAKVVDGLNWMVRQLPGDVNDYTPINTEAIQDEALFAVMIANMEEEWGVPFDQWTQTQRETFLEAQIAAMTGDYENDWAREAQAELDEINVARALVRAAPTPFGGTQIRSEVVDTQRDAVADAYATPYGGRTPAQENVIAKEAQINAGSPEAAELNTLNDIYQSLGTQRQKDLAEGWNIIANGELPPDAVETIGGRDFLGSYINNLPEDERMKLADAWVLDYLGSDELKQYREDRKAFIAANPGIFSEYKTYQKAAGEYNGGTQIDYVVRDGKIVRVVTGGVRDFRDAMDNSAYPQFEAALDDERQRLIAQGVTGEQLEERLDQWTMSESGFLAFSGTKDRLRDPEPLPAYDDTADPPLPGSTTAAPASTSGESDSPGWDEENGRPQYQTDLANEYGTYMDAVTAFEAENGPITNFTSDMGKRVLSRNLPEMSWQLERYFRWAADEQAAGRPGTIEDYFAKLDKEYEERKAGEAA